MSQWTTGKQSQVLQLSCEQPTIRPRRSSSLTVITEGPPDELGRGPDEDCLVKWRKDDGEKVEIRTSEPTLLVASAYKESGEHPYGELALFSQSDQFYYFFRLPRIWVERRKEIDRLLNS